MVIVIIIIITYITTDIVVVGCSVRIGPERRSGPFKMTRLMVKLHQAYVLAGEGLAR